MHDKTTTIEQFLTAAAAKQPTPGGGSVAALAGALAASMGEMVVNYSINKKGLESHAVELKSALTQLHNARLLLLGLMAEDQTAYESLTAAKKMPANGQEKSEAIAIALLASIRVPQAMVATAISVLELCDKLVEIVNFYLLSDLAVCADLSMATARCAIYNVRINLPELKDESQRWQVQTSNDQMLTRAIIAIQRVSPRIWARVAKGA